MLELSEAAARAEGFTTLELMFTIAGAPLHRAFGFEPVADVVEERTAVPIPLIRMRKRIG